MNAVPWMCLAALVVGLWDLGRAYLSSRRTNPSPRMQYVPGSVLAASALILFALSQQRYATPVPRGWDEGYSTDPVSRPDERHRCPAEDLLCATPAPSAGTVASYAVRLSGGRWDGTMDTLMSFAAVTLRSVPEVGAPRLGRVETVEMGQRTVGRYELTATGARVLVYVLPSASGHLSVQYVAATEEFEKFLPAIDDAVRATHGPRDVTFVPWLLIGLIVLTKGTSMALAKRTVRRPPGQPG